MQNQRLLETMKKTMSGRKRSVCRLGLPDSSFSVSDLEFLKPLNFLETAFFFYCALFKPILNHLTPFARLQTQYVTLSLPPTTTLTHAIACNSTSQLIGLHSPSPFLRLGTAYFKGEHVQTIGTDLIFAAEEGGADDTQTGATKWKNIRSRGSLPANAILPPIGATKERKEANLVATTTKKIMFAQVKVAMKKDEADDKGEGQPEGEQSALEPTTTEDVEMSEAPTAAAAALSTPEAEEPAPYKPIIESRTSRSKK